VIALAIQLGGSLLAVLLLWALAHTFGLGGDVRIRDEDHARRLAHEAEWGFDCVEVGLDRAGIGALIRDSQGRVMLLRRHGVHFAARLIESHQGIRLNQNFITIPPCGPRFAGLTLDLGAKSQTWAASLRRLGA
jgi:hypothetical protein